MQVGFVLQALVSNLPLGSNNGISHTRPVLGELKVYQKLNWSNPQLCARVPLMPAGLTFVDQCQPSDHPSGAVTAVG